MNITMQRLQELGLLPNSEFLDVLDDYQQRAASQVQFDSRTRTAPQGQEIRTIYGYPEEVYHWLGIKEEFDETFGDDEVNPGYNRVGALMIAGPLRQAKSIPGVTVDPGEVTEDAIRLHTKEFGDISWHTVNFLGLYGLKASDAVLRAAHRRSLELENKKEPGEAEFRRSADLIVPGVSYSLAGINLLSSAEAVISETTPNPDLCNQLAIHAGEALLYGANLVEIKFDLPFAEVLAANLEKIDRRIREYTIFKTDTIYGDLR